MLQGSEEMVTIGLAESTSAKEWPEGAAGRAITVLCPTENSRLRNRRPTSYKPCDFCGVIPFGDVERHLAEYHPEKLIRPCELCDSRFRTYRQLSRHVLRVHGPDLHCPVCSSTFSSVGIFTKHLNDAHAQIPSEFMCVVCRMSLHSSVDYCTHMESHQAEASLLGVEGQGAVEEVDRRFDNPSDHTDEEAENDLTCRHCQKTLKSPVALKRHLLVVHRDRPTFKCDICFLKFQSSGGLLDHTESHTTGALQCPLCKQQFAKFYHLRSHCDIVHSDTASFHCQHCSYVAKSINGLFTHVLVRHPDQLGMARNVRCSKCGEKFHSGLQLSQHKATHHAKLVDCVHCGKQMSKYLIAAHINEKHTKNQKIECSYCGTTFFNPYKHSQHVKRHHLREHYARFVCEICGKAYITRHELLRHTAAHNNERKHKCETCGRGYFKAGDLTYHRRTHTGERPHKCNYCEGAFSRPSELTSHLSRSHGICNSSRPYVRTAPDNYQFAQDPLSATSMSSRRPSDKNINIKDPGTSEFTGNAMQLITEVDEEGQIVHIVDGDGASLQVMEELPQELEGNQPPQLEQGDMQVIYVKLME